MLSSGEAAESVTSAAPAPMGARSVGRTLLATAAIQISGVVSGALVAHLLGPAERGLLAAIVLWPTIVVYLGDLGGPLAYTFLSSRAISRGERIDGLAGAIPGISTVQSLVLVSIGVPISVVALSGYPSVVSLAVAFAVGYIPLNLLTRYANSLNQGTGNFTRFNSVRATVQFAYVGGVVVIFATGHGSLTLVLWATIGSNIAALVIAIAPWWRPMAARRWRLDLAVIRQTFGYGMRAQVGNLNPMEVLQLDLAAVFILLGAHAAGLYAVAVSISLALRSAGISVGMVAMPAVARTEDAALRSAAIGRSVRLTVIFAVPGAVLLAAVAGVLVPTVFGQPFADATPAVQILAVAAGMASVKRVLGDCLRGFGEPMAASAAELIGVLVGLAALIATTVPFGLVGAATSAAAAYLTSLLISVLIAWRRIGIAPLSLLLPKADDLRLAFSVVLEAVRPPRLASGSAR